jgi:hypothetical protein
MNTAPEHLQSVLDFCVDFAKTMLERHGEFYPFGSLVDGEGRVVANAAWTGDEHPVGQDHYKFLLAALRQKLADGGAIAIAVAADVNIPDGYGAPRKDGIRVLLETHGFSCFVYYPYRLERKGLFRRRNIVELFQDFVVELESAL